MSQNNRKHLLVILQNAWRPGEKFIKDEEWIQALWESQTGKRLLEMLPIGNISIVIINSTPKIGTTPDSIFPPDIDYIQRKINEVRPDVILCCGKVAQQALNAIGITYISSYHPAYRGLSKAMTKDTRYEITKQLWKV